MLDHFIEVLQKSCDDWITDTISLKARYTNQVTCVLLQKARTLLPRHVDRYTPQQVDNALLVVNDYVDTVLKTTDYYWLKKFLDHESWFKLRESLERSGDFEYDDTILKSRKVKKDALQATKVLLEQCIFKK